MTIVKCSLLAEELWGDLDGVSRTKRKLREGNCGVGAVARGRDRVVAHSERC